MRQKDIRGYFRAAGVAIAVAIPGAVLSQAAEEAQITGQPLVYVKAGKLEGCGVRFVAALIGPNLKTGRGFDASVNVWTGGPAAVKALSYNVDVGAINAGSKPKASPLESFWIRAPGHQPTRPVDGYFRDSEDVGGKIYGVSFDMALPIFKAVFEEGPLMFGLQRKGERGERIYFGTIKMSDAERDQTLKCLLDLAK
jgi:hypothetical protein